MPLKERAGVTVVHLLQENERIYLKREAGICGIPKGTEGTIQYVASPSEVYPVQVEFDKPDEDGHFIHRIRLNEVGLCETEKVPLGVVTP